MDGGAGGGTPGAAEAAHRACAPGTGQPRSRRSLAAALAANAVAAVVKLAAFWVTGVPVLLAEGLHSVADSGNEVALLLGHRTAAAPPSARHPLGVSRVRYLWAFTTAIVMFGGAAIGTFTEATFRLLHPEHSQYLAVTAGALGIALVIECVSFGTVITESAAARRGDGLIRFIRRSRDPDLPVLLVEDAAGLAGVALALLGTVLAAVTGIFVIDVVASDLIGLLLVANAVFLAWEMASLILGERAEPEAEEAVRRALAADGTAGEVTAVRAVHLGPDDLLVIASLRIGPGWRGAEFIPRLREAGDRARQVSPAVRQVLFDLDLSPGAPLAGPGPPAREDRSGQEQ